MIFLFLSLTYLRNVCLPGSSMCDGNSMHVCDINSKWVIVECPDNTVCKVQNGTLSCIPTAQDENETDKNNNSENDENNNMEDEDLNENNEEDGDENEDDQKENEEGEDFGDHENISIPRILKNKLGGKKNRTMPKRNLEKSIPKGSVLGKNNIRVITKTLVRDGGPKNKKSKNGNDNIKNIINVSNNKKDDPGSKHQPENKRKDDSKKDKKGDDTKNGHPKDKDSKDKGAKDKDDKKKDSEKDDDSKDKESKDKDNKEKPKEKGNGKGKGENGSDNKNDKNDKNIKTVTIKGSDDKGNNKDNHGNNDGPKTVTVTTTIKSPPKKPEEIQLEYTNGQPKTQAQPNVNMNDLFKLLQEIKKSGDQQKIGGSGASMGQQPSGAGGSPAMTGQTPQAGGGSPTASSISSSLGSAPKPSGGGSAPSSGGSAPKPSGGGSAPSSGGSAPKPSGGGSAPSTGGSAPKPSGGGSAPSTGGSAPKPSGGGDSKPSGGGSTPSTGGSGSKPSGGGDSKPSGGGDSKPSGEGGVDKDKIQKAVEEAGYTPNPEYLDAVAEKMSDAFDSVDEAAMFLAQIIHESAGLTKIEEEACANGGCEGQYGSDQGEPGKSYHGRGFIQLTWPDNYKAASEGLGMGDELYKNPEKVSEDPKIAMDVSIWFWQNRVANQPGVKEGQFGATTKAINGPIECSGGGNDTPQKRYDIYTKVAKILGVTNLASPDGC
ncbi:hypothetical protein H311_02220 [Anncaliia algerae PRA109]|nr:hypothetical protein H311_02220 [Anncaliia algerae PRA109]